MVRKMNSCENSLKQKVEDRLGLDVTAVEERSSAVLVFTEGYTTVPPWELNIITCACGHVADRQERYEVKYLVYAREVAFNILDES